MFFERAFFCVIGFSPALGGVNVPVNALGSQVIHYLFSDVMKIPNVCWAAKDYLHDTSTVFGFQMGPSKLTTREAMAFKNDSSVFTEVHCPLPHSFFKFTGSLTSMKAKNIL